MPFIAHTPEALLPRSDSRNPATTCKGITSNGRPCRRSLAASPRSSPGRHRGDGNGVLAVLHDEDGRLGSDAAAFYCWQHKDQANQLATGTENSTEVFPLKQRSSIDTLVDRLGVLDVDQPEKDHKKKKHRSHRQLQPQQGIKKRDTLPSKWQDVPGPLLTVPEEVAETRTTHRRSRPIKERPIRRTHKVINIFCCTQPPDDEIIPPSKPHYVTEASGTGSTPRPQMTQNQRTNQLLTPPSPKYSSPRPSNASTPIRRRPVSSNIDGQSLTPPNHHASPRRQSDSAYTPTRPSMSGPSPKPSHSDTQLLLSHIPSTLPPHTTSLLLTELAKPISSADEAGYIYMFWLTPESQASHPAESESTSLLAPPPLPPSSSSNSRESPASARSNGRRRTSDVLQRYGSVSHSTSTSTSHSPSLPSPSPRDPSTAAASAAAAEEQAQSQKTILLKIGRAANVQRRLQQWSKQCSHNVSLIRYYPYVPSSSCGTFGTSGGSSSSAEVPAPAPRKVPHMHRVERLIHIELAEKRATGRGSCGNCGKEHREWFEIGARMEELREVDAVVRRWVGWAEEMERERGRM